MYRLDTIRNQINFQKPKLLAGKTVVVTGGSRGIGLAIAVRCAKDGANIAILAKTIKEQPTLPGTIYTAADQIQKAGGAVLALPCDIRNQTRVKQCIAQVVDRFGGIDILINNASAINLSNTIDQSMKRYDLMHQINMRGTFMVSKYCLPYLIKSQNPHILNMAPPLDLNSKWYQTYLAYSIAKYGMSMCVIGMSEQFKKEGVAVNGLWPKTPIATAAVQNIVGGDEDMKRSRTTQIMGDAAFLIVTSNSRENTGNFYYDEQILKQHGVTDFRKYKYQHIMPLKQAVQTGRK